MKPRFLFTAMLLALGLAASAAESAASVVEKTAAKLKAAPSLSAVFTASQGPDQVEGSLTMASDKFHLKMAGMETWFDGLTQWTFSEQIGEVNITNPTRQEVVEINPLAVVGELKKNYSLRLLSAPKGFYKVELTPKQKQAAVFSKAVVTVNASTWLPVGINITGSDGRATVVRIDSLKVGKAMDQSAFKFNPKKYPGVEIVDLR